ncbi:MAG: type II secretion system protein [Isosphaeraceae bacterium]
MNRNARGLAAAPAPGRRIFGRGFTLIELLIVITIMALLTVAALPTILSSLDEREILDAAGMLQSALLVSRDTAMRTGSASGIRLLLDPEVSTNGALAANRMVPITQAPDFNNGLIHLDKLSYTTTYTHPVSGATLPINFSMLVAYEHKFNTAGVDPDYSPTGWYWNIRQGEKMRINGASRAYTVAGPLLSGSSGNMAVSNPERFLNADILSGNTRVVSLPTFAPNYSSGTVVPPYVYQLAPDNWTPIGPPAVPPVWNYNSGGGPLGNQYQVDTSFTGDPYHYVNVLNRIRLTAAEYVVLFDGIDNDQDGFVDEGFDGIDNDGDGIIDPGFNGIDDNGDGVIDDPAEMLLRYNPMIPASGEYEPEDFDATTSKSVAAGSATAAPSRYVITRRAVVSENAKETRLPANIVIDLTMLDRYSSTAISLQPERSRLPLDPISQTVDILFGPNGQVIEDTAGINTLFNNRNLPFYHFWLATKSDVYGIAHTGGNPANLTLNPANARFLPTSVSSPTTLKGQRRLVTLFPKTGNTVVNSLEDFTTIEQPYLDAQFGKREP